MKKQIYSLLILLSFIWPVVGLSAEPANSSIENSDSFSIKHVSVPGTWQANFRFSERIIVTNPGKFIFLAGVGAQADDGEYGAALHPGDVDAQCRAIWTNIVKQLKAEGATLDNIVRVKTYVTDAQYLLETADCWNDFVGREQPYPNDTFIVVSALADPEMLIEIEVTAALP